MSLFKKPSELQAKPGLVAMIYGQPGSGKTTLACSAPGAVLIDTDGGVMRINGAHMVPTLQVENWEQIEAAMEEVRSNPEIKSIIIDTIGKMLTYLEEYIIRTSTGKRIEVNRDGRSLSLKGFGKRKQIFSDFIKKSVILGRNVIFVGHDKEEKRAGGDETVIRPEVGGSSTNDLMKELDLVGYMEMNGNIRTISFTPTDRFYAKNTCDMPGVIPIDELINDKKEIIRENNFFNKVIAAYRQRIQSNIENNRRLDELKLDIEQNLENVTDADTANRYVEWCRTLNHVYNSAAIAKTAISRKAKSLGLTFDPLTKKYVNPAPAETTEESTVETATAQKDGDAA